MGADTFPWPRAWAYGVIVLATCGLIPRTTAPPPFVDGEAVLAPNQGGIEFRFEGRPWGEVFKWLVDQTGKPLISRHKPRGTFTFTGPKGARYSMHEVIKILDRTLQRQGLRLLVGRATFTLVPAGEAP